MVRFSLRFDMGGAGNQSFEVMLNANFLFRFSALVLLVSPSRAADAFFSADGKTVTLSVMVPSSLTGLVTVDLANGKTAEVGLPEDWVEGDIKSIARGAVGETLLLAKDSVWVLKQGGVVKKSVACGPAKMASGLFVAPPAGQPAVAAMVCSAKDSEDSQSGPVFYGLQPGARKFSEIFCRRVESAENGCFTEDGRLFFVSSGDLWEGAIQPMDGGEMAGILVGSRILPLALLNTDSGNGGSLSLDQIAPAGNWIYGALRGLHDAAIVRTPMPDQTAYGTEDQEIPTLEATYAVQGKALAETEIIAEGLGDIHGFCATETDGKPMVFYYTAPQGGEEGAALMLWNGSGAPRKIGQLPPAKDE